MLFFCLLDDCIARPTSICLFFVEENSFPLLKQQGLCKVRTGWQRMAADGGWRMADGGWRMADGGWRMADGGWRMADGGWRMADGGWRMADGGWRMADGGWRMADGGWKNAYGKIRMEKFGWKNADDKMRMIHVKSKCGNHIADDKILTRENTLRVKQITLKRSDVSLTSDVTETLNF